MRFALPSQLVRRYETKSMTSGRSVRVWLDLAGFNAPITISPPTFFVVANRDSVEAVAG